MYSIFTSAYAHTHTHKYTYIYIVVAQSVHICSLFTCYTRTHMAQETVRCSAGVAGCTLWPITVFPVFL